MADVRVRVDAEENPEEVLRAAWNWLDQAVKEEEINEGFKRAFGTHAPWWRRVFFGGWNVRGIFDRTRCGHSLMDIESVKVTLQAATLLAVVVGLGFTFYQVRLLRLSYVDLMTGIEGRLLRMPSSE